MTATGNFQVYRAFNRLTVHPPSHLGSSFPAVGMDSQTVSPTENLSNAVVLSPDVHPYPDVWLGFGSSPRDLVKDVVGQVVLLVQFVDVTSHSVSDIPSPFSVLFASFACTSSQSGGICRSDCIWYRRLGIHFFWFSLEGFSRVVWSRSTCRCFGLSMVWL